MHPLSWLPIHPDLGSAIRSARAKNDEKERFCSAMELTGYRRDLVATAKLDRLLVECPGAFARTVPYGDLSVTPARLAILSSHTVDHLVPAIRVSALNRRVALSAHVGRYGLYRQALLDSEPDLAAFEPQFILLALDEHDMPFDLSLDAPEQDVESAIRERVDDLRSLWRAGRERYRAQVIQQTFVPGAPLLFGSFEGLVPGSSFSLLEHLNAAIRKAARSDGVLLLDIAWHGYHLLPKGAVADPVRWHHAKQLIDPAAAPIYGDMVARVIAASLGLSRKCLVLDLDNTLWGGVIGDDGVEGIRLGQGDPLGEAYLAMQRYVSSLGRRGIVLAVCSKNDPGIAASAFSEHADMVLRRCDFACFVANWDDKATNLRRIARELDLGLESFVFVDDNPAERDIIRRELPAVAVPELPDDAAGYPECLSDAGYFEVSAFTSDDIARARSYEINSKLRENASGKTDMEGYLRSLGMTLLASEIRPLDMPRAAQLINKSNQFNLTTRRYTQPELERFAAEPGNLAACFRLRDRFADHGLISVILARTKSDGRHNILSIDSWLMSCRVLGRQVEMAVLDVLIEEAARRGCEVIAGEYKPTARNALVSRHYEKLGFAPPDGLSTGDDHSTFWQLNIGSRPALRHFITVERVQ